MIHNTTIKSVRGDTIEIPIKPTINPLATYRCQLREKPDSETFYSLLIEGQKIIITPEQSATLNEGTYYCELEQNLGGDVTTLQRTAVFISEDYTHTFGDEAPPWETNQSVEVAEMISKGLFIRKPDNSLIDVEGIATATDAAKDEALQAASDVQSATDLANEKAALADSKATLADQKAALANTAASNADTKAILADTKATLADSKATLADEAATRANNAATLIDEGLRIVPRIFESYASLPANVETTIPGTDFEPVLNLRPSGVQVFYDGELKNVAMRYVANGDNYDVKLTSPVTLAGAEIFILGTLLKPFVILFTLHKWSDNSKWDDNETWVD